MFSKLKNTTTKNNKGPETFWSNGDGILEIVILIKESVIMVWTDFLMKIYNFS